MFPVIGGPCRTIAPLIARYNDPDLEECERVLLSTHLLQCPHCLGQLQEYRALDQRLRRMPSITLSPQARELVLDRVTSPNPGLLALGFATFGRQAWLGAATALSLTALVLVFSFNTFRTAQGANGALSQEMVGNTTTVQPLTTTILHSESTQVVNRVSETVSGTMVIGGLRAGASLAVAAPLPVLATVREVRARDGYLIVLPDGAAQAERLVITRTTVIVWSDGKAATLADIDAGAVIQVLYDQPIGDVPAARRVILSR